MYYTTVSGITPIIFFVIVFVGFAVFAYIAEGNVTFYGEHFPVLIGVFVAAAIILLIWQSLSTSRSGTLTLHYPDGDVTYTVEERMQKFSGSKLDEFTSTTGVRGEVNVPYSLKWE